MPDSWTVGAPPLLYTQERGRREPKPRASPGFDSPPDTLGPLQGLFAGRIRESIPACQWFDTPGSKRTEIHTRELVVKCRRKRNSADILASRGAPGARCRPFDEKRGGTIRGEGAAVFILESSVHARRRGATPRASIRGYGFVTHARSMFAPAPLGEDVLAAARRAMRRGFEDGVDWVVAHGTGTRKNDAAECRGLHALLGERFAATPLTALKPALGHCLGASGALDTAAAVIAMEEGFIPATRNTTHFDPDLPRCDLVTEVRDRASKRVLLLSESFGGRATALLVERRDGTDLWEAGSRVGGIISAWSDHDAGLRPHCPEVRPGHTKGGNPCPPVSAGFVPRF